MKMFEDILKQSNFSKNDLIILLSATGAEHKLLIEAGSRKKKDNIGNKVYFRGLVEFSNICSKDCFYCGIRKSNSKVIRYKLTDEQILSACYFAWKNKFASVVLQSGESSSGVFTNRVNNLVKRIKRLSNNELGITLSCGEQTRDTYQKWFESGAHRYLLRIEASNRNLYYKIHPNNKKHSFDKRLEALEFLKDAGYQVGTGVMIGLPFQTVEDLADDLLFFKELDIDMCGMGPYIEHENTPLYKFKEQLLSKQKRLELALKMIAVLRLLMPDINIASATALEAIDPAGREMALDAGANIIMPNLTPNQYREEYFLYENKPGLFEATEISLKKLQQRINTAGFEIGFGEYGDSKHFFHRVK